jgi:acyl-CoA thioester hydrolase
MARPDPALLDPARYPFRCRIAPRFIDLDLNMHVNNVAMCGLLQEARVHFHAASKYHDAVAGMTSMAASFAVEYLGEAHYPQEIDFCVAASAVGRTSHTLAQLALQDGRPVAWAQAVIVTIDDGRPTPHSAQFLDQITHWMLQS